MFSNSVLLKWQNEIFIQKGYLFHIGIIRLGIINTVESWTYLDLKCSLDNFRSYGSGWSAPLTKQTMNDLFNECIILKN